jgi:hypothetical protein
MKLSDYIANFFVAQMIRYVFVVTGGAAAYLIDSIVKKSDREQNIKENRGKHSPSLKDRVALEYNGLTATINHKGGVLRRCL